jgi:hypothetical protein
MGAGSLKKSEHTIVQYQYYEFHPFTSFFQKLKAVPVGKPCEKFDVVTSWGEHISTVFLDKSTVIPEHIAGFEGHKPEQLYWGYSGVKNNYFLFGLTPVDELPTDQATSNNFPATPLGELQLEDKIEYIRLKLKDNYAKLGSVEIESLSDNCIGFDVVKVRGKDYQTFIIIDKLIEFFNPVRPEDEQLFSIADWVCYLVDNSIKTEDVTPAEIKPINKWADLIYDQFRRLGLTSEFSPHEYLAVSPLNATQVEIIDGVNIWVFEGELFHRFLFQRDFVSLNPQNDFYVITLYRAWLDANHLMDATWPHDKGGDVTYLIKDSQSKIKQLAQDAVFHDALQRLITTIGEYLVVRAMTPDSVLESPPAVEGVKIIDILLSDKEFKKPSP